MGILRLCESPPLLSPEATVRQAVIQMTQKKVGAIAVTHGRKVIGVFTERDLMSRVVARGKDPDATALSEVMTAPVRTVGEDISVEEAATIMRQNHFRHLPVVDANGDFLGMVALRYLLYEIMDELDAKVGDLEQYIMEDSRGG